MYKLSNQVILNRFLQQVYRYGLTSVKTLRQFLQHGTSKGEDQEMSESVGVCSVTPSLPFDESELYKTGLTAYKLFIEEKLVFALLRCYIGQK